MHLQSSGWQDVDRSGSLSRVELEKGLRHINPDVGQEDVRTALEFLDQDHSGVVRTANLHPLSGLFHSWCVCEAHLGDVGCDLLLSAIHSQSVQS